MEKKNMALAILRGVLTVAFTLAALAVTAGLGLCLLLGGGTQSRAAQGNPVNVGIMDRFDMYMTNQVSSALEGVLTIDKVYWLSDDDVIAPEPDQSKFGVTDDPASLAGFLEEARELLGVENTLFSTDTQLHIHTKVNYYLDETIMAITWQQMFDRAIYTITEVKIAHPSQFRRFLAGGTYGSEKQFTTTEMAASVNAVVASSGDFYKFRRAGTIVYNGVVQRVNSTKVDTCFIDDQGDLIFSRAGEIIDEAQAQAYVDEHNIRFSLAFGPILVEDGKACPPSQYPLGEIDGLYARAALCQMEELHYLLITVNGEDLKDNGVAWYWDLPTIHTFANRVATFGCEKAYALDGGQTAVIAMNDRLINRVHYGYQREISDIIYFATAIPDGE